MGKVIMIQGTSSGAGKSVLSTALCRIFKQDGYKVAPFKAQNMSSNYHTLANGDKMARSQAIAAYACGIAPHVDMNPVLLMPSDRTSADVILNGKSNGALDSPTYTEFKQNAFSHVLEAFHRLSSTHDIIVAEGAGSPVEMNLIQNDIVNMSFAEAVQAPVILISDITRGGTFASLYGTMMLLTEAQKALVKGLVVNKFKGDISYFGDGKSIIEQLCTTPVVGVIPHTAIKIEDEDSITDFGHEAKTRQLFENNMEQAFDELAAHFRTYLEMEKIYEII